MANNRMSIKCNVCGKEKVIAKYYPSTGWCFFCLLEDNPASPKAFNEWMKEHRHDDYSMWGPQHFTLEFEIKEDKNEVEM